MSEIKLSLVRRTATPEEQIAIAVLRAFADSPSLVEMRPAMSTANGVTTYSFGVMIDRGEHADSMTATMTLSVSGAKLQATATDEREEFFGPGSLTDVLDMLVFEHGGEHCKILHMG